MRGLLLTVGFLGLVGIGCTADLSGEDVTGGVAYLVGARPETQRELGISHWSVEARGRRTRIEGIAPNGRVVGWIEVIAVPHARRIIARFSTGAQIVWQSAELLEAPAELDDQTALWFVAMHLDRVEIPRTPIQTTYAALEGYDDGSGGYDDGSGSGYDDGSSSGYDDGSSSGYDDGSSSGYDDGTGTGTGADDGSGTGADDGTGTGADDGTGTGTGADDGTGTGTDDGTGTGADDGTGTGTDDGTGTGTDDGTGTGTDTDPGTSSDDPWGPAETEPSSPESAAAETGSEASDPASSEAASGSDASSGSETPASSDTPASTMPETPRFRCVNQGAMVAACVRAAWECGPVGWASTARAVIGRALGRLAGAAAEAADGYGCLSSGADCTREAMGSECSGDLTA